MGLIPWRGTGSERALWRDPARAIRTLEGFARTEADGALDIATAEQRCAEPWLRVHLRRHAADERRHAELFEGRVRDLRALHPGLVVADAEPRHDLALGRKSSEVDAHGFFVAGLIEELGEVAYVAMLHVAEQRAARLFRRLRDASVDDPTTQAIFDAILKDEQYHVAYTRKALDHWRAQGRDGEVSRALASARDQRLLGGWKRLGMRSAAGLGHGLLWIAYHSVIVPFGLVARAMRRDLGWKAPLERDAARRLRSQF